MYVLVYTYIHIHTYIPLCIYVYRSARKFIFEFIFKHFEKISKFVIYTSMIYITIALTYKAFFVLLCSRLLFLAFRCHWKVVWSFFRLSLSNRNCKNWGFENILKILCVFSNVCFFYIFAIFLPKYVCIFI